MDVSNITDNAIVYVLLAWLVILGVAKALHLERRGFDLKIYSLVYKNPNVQSTLTRMLGRTRRGVRIFADVSVVAGFLMMGFAFWFLLSNVYAYFAEPVDFAQLTVLIPGVTLTSVYAILYFLLSIPIVLVMHEGAHGIVATLERIKIKTGGFAIFVAFVAGFVEPDEDEFSRAKKVSRLRVIGAGATSNVAFALALSVIMLSNPLFAIVLPEPLQEIFYEIPEGVRVESLIAGGGAEAAGMLPGDIVTQVGDRDIVDPTSFAALGLVPGDTVMVDVLRDGTPIQFAVDVTESAEDPGRGLIGIMRDNSFSYQPVLDFIIWDNHHISMFLLWLWMISFFIGVINMLPLPVLDGGKFVQTIIEGRTSEVMVRNIMWAIYAFTFALFALNIALSYMRSGWFTI